MSSTHKSTLLVTGASGHLGRRVVELLAETREETIIAATRTPEKLADLNQHGIIVRHADFDDPASLLQAFKGVDRLLLISTDAVGERGRRINQHRNAVKAAEQAGVHHVIYTSLMNPGPDSPVFLAPDHHSTEEALKESAMSWTVLRENIYTEGLLMSMAQAVKTGTLSNAIRDGKTAYVTREDVARAAAATLASSFDGQRILDVTGPEAVSQYDVAAIASKITGREISYIPLELETLVENMVSGGLPRPVAKNYASFDEGIASGRFSAVTNVVEELTGRKPVSVADFLSAHRDALIPATS